jgi:hypothetical protein
MKFMKMHLFHEISLDFNGQKGPPNEVTALQVFLKCSFFSPLFLFLSLFRSQFARPQFKIVSVPFRKPRRSLRDVRGLWTPEAEDRILVLRRCDR